jgi:transcriptional regulator with XRE-family HTH domain
MGQDFYAEFCYSMSAMTLTEAIRELRRLSELSQQFFATELKMSTRALGQYESGKTPEPKQLMAFCAYARKKNRPDLEQIFNEALAWELEPGVQVLLEEDVIRKLARQFEAFEKRLRQFQAIEKRLRQCVERIEAIETLLGRPVENPPVRKGKSK